MILPCLLGLALTLAQRDSSEPELIDGFEQASAWSAHPADGVLATLHTDRGRTGQALRLDFDFQGGGGYAIARRALAIDLPANYAFTFWLRGTSPVNTLEFKLVDSTGENVWWYTERDRRFDGTWQRVTVRRRQIGFAWGPAGGGELRHPAALELVITAGRGGGRGSVWFDDLTLTPLPDLGPYDRVPLATASAALPAHPPAFALDGDSTTAWQARAGSHVELTVDFQRPREFGGLTLRWSAGGGARDYDVLLSDDGASWETIRRVRSGDGGRDDLFLPDQEGRYLRLALLAPAGTRDYRLADLVVQPLTYGASLNGFWQVIAAGSPPGSYPRYLSGTRAYWTVVGVDGAREEALINEDGAVEAGKGEFSVEPFLADSGRLYSWHEASQRVSLAQGALPLPSVEWTMGTLRLTVTAFAVGPASGSSAVVRYRVRNTGHGTRRPTLYLAVRPFQVNPPWQFLNTPGGAARVDSLRWTGTALRVNANREVIPFTPPAQVAVSPFDGGEIVSHLRDGRLPPARVVRDPFAAASGVLAWPLNLPAGTARDVAIEIPLTGDLRANLAPAPLSRVTDAEAGTSGWWQQALDRATISLPPAGDHLARTIRSTLAYILINRDGPSIQPGSRSYERSWIRDGSLTSAALLRFGQPEVVREFIEWYAGFQYPSGKVPCCVDARGADPVPEHDSHGEFIYLVMEYWRHTGDDSLLARMWPHVLRAADYIDSLRQTGRTAEYRAPERRAFFGLLPPSISHEGYSAKPMHSYWDDFFALRGLKDAARMAEVLGHPDDAARLAAMRDEFRADLLASLERVMREHAIDYLPGAADLGDFDPTSTTIAVSPVGELSSLPHGALERTFEHYWENTVARRSPGSTWEAYTPYEMRTVGTMLRLFGKERALDLLRMFLDDQEPREWNQWPEVVWHDRRAPRFIGDLPHTWVGSDFLRSAADLFVYEDEADSALVLAAGVDEAWLTAPGVVVRNLSTWWGPLSYSMARMGSEVRAHIAAGTRIPVGGIRLVAPSPGSLRRATLNGTAVSVDGSGTVVLRRLPAEVVFEY